MAWWDAALSIASTIGRVAGALQGGGPVGVDFGHLGGDVDPKLGQLIFFNAPGGLMALNQSTRQSVGIYFPGDEALATTPPMAAIIPEGSKLKMADAFRLYGDADLEEFEVTPGPLRALGAETDGQNMTLQSRTTQPVLPNAKLQLGPYFDLTLNVPERTLLLGALGGLTLVGIVLLNIRGAGSTTVKIINALRRAGADANDDDQHITVPLPAGPDIDAGLTYVEVIAAVEYPASLPDDLARSAGLAISPITDEDRAAIAAIAAARQ